MYYLITLIVYPAARLLAEGVAKLRPSTVLEDETFMIGVELNNEWLLSVRRDALSLTLFYPERLRGKLRKVWSSLSPNGIDHMPTYY